LKIIYSSISENLEPNKAIFKQITGVLWISRIINTLRTLKMNQAGITSSESNGGKGVDSR
jgi:hypothetical protein